MRRAPDGRSMWRGSFDSSTVNRRFLFRGDPVLDESAKVVKQVRRRKIRHHRIGYEPFSQAGGTRNSS